MADLKDRIIRAAKLDVNLYEEVEADKNALGQAMTVVALSSAAAGVGASLQGGIEGIFWGVIAALLGWYVWAYITYIIGTKFFPEPQTEADLGQLLRTTGFSSAPGLIRVLAIVPGLTVIAFLAASIWMLVAMVVAVRQALDYSSTYRAVGVCLLGWVVQALIIVLFFYLLGERTLGVEA
ncbi:MAG: YIP1 family protein [Deltaproteobacteria bacterium]|nr:YIP1 family protein [Deltaproteobacteria bacterium]